MRKISLVATAVLSLLLLSGATSYAADIELPDVPVGIPKPPGEGEAGAATECKTKSKLGVYPDETQPKSSTICVYRDGTRVWGSVDFHAAAWSSGTEVIFDLAVYRCRVVDNVCVEISSTYDRKETNSRGYTFTETAPTTQTWDDRYYKACASMSSSLDFGYGRTCTPNLSD